MSAADLLMLPLLLLLPLLLPPLLLLPAEAILSPEETVVTKEACQFQSMEISCSFGAVVLMRDARYGRMRTGKCVMKSFGHLRCSANVLSELDRQCSGRQRCSVSVTKLRDTVQPCPKDLTAYLEASYSCVSVRHGVCPKGRGFVETRELEGYVSSILFKSRQGSLDCPVRVSALPGQRINVTILNFRRLSDKRYVLPPVDVLHNVIPESPCPFYASLGEIYTNSTTATTVNLSLCGGDSRRHHLYLSSGHALNIAILNRSATFSGHVLLQYQVVGCPDPSAPPDTIVERPQPSGAVIKCKHSTEIWYLTCKGNSWIGEVSNCTTVSPLREKTQIGEDTEQFPLGLLIAITIGVILGVIIGLALLIAVFLYRKRARRERLRCKASELLDDDVIAGGSVPIDPGVYEARRAHANGTNVTSSSALTKTGEYTPMWELRRDVPYCCTTSFSTFKPEAMAGEATPRTPFYGRGGERAVAVAAERPPERGAPDVVSDSSDGAAVCSCVRETGVFERRCGGNVYTTSVT